MRVGLAKSGLRLFRKIEILSEIEILSWTRSGRRYPDINTCGGFALAGFQEQTLARGASGEAGSLRACVFRGFQEAILKRGLMLDPPAAPGDRLAFRCRRLFVQGCQHLRKRDGLLATCRVGQKSLEAFDKLIAAGEMVPATRQHFIIVTERGISRLLSALLCVGGTFKAIRNMST